MFETEILTSQSDSHRIVGKKTRGGKLLFARPGLSYRIEADDGVYYGTADAEGVAVMRHEGDRR